MRDLVFFALTAATIASANPITPDSQPAQLPIPSKFVVSNFTALDHLHGADLYYDFNAEVLPNYITVPIGCSGNAAGQENFINCASVPGPNKNIQAYIATDSSKTGAGRYTLHIRYIQAFQGKRLFADGQHQLYENYGTHSPPATFEVPVTSHFSEPL